MAKSNKMRSVRVRLVEALRNELLGPSEPNEQLHSEYPTSRYLVGRLAPARQDENDEDAKVEEVENETLAAGPEDDEAGADEPQAPLIIGFHPSSMGISFMVAPEAAELNVTVSWGDYKREKNAEDQTVWQRYPRRTEISGIPVNRIGSLPSIELGASAEVPPGITVTGIGDEEVTLEGVVHDVEGFRAVSLFLVNRRTKGKLGDRTKDERWIFQPQIRIASSTGEAIFVAKDRLVGGHADDDGEVAKNNLLYRHASEYATGHGVAACWDSPAVGSSRTTAVFTEFIPEKEVPSLIAPADITGGAVLDMKELAEATSGKQVADWLWPMVKAYEEWIELRETESRLPEIAGDDQMADAAKVSLEDCRTCAKRMTKGLELLEKDPLVFQAFCFANRAMWDQRIHSIWGSENRKRGEVQGTAADFDNPKNRTWRPFQMGFILLNLVGIAKEDSDDRRLVDLLWFPTGGGKTEAYLGLAAFTLGLRRLRGDQHGMVAGAGVSIIMRYTLRLLTVQQFQRATALIAACEVIRRDAPKKWGEEPFRIGLWVGRGTTPNDYQSSKKALEALNNDAYPEEGSPVQLVACPRCGTSLVTERGRPENQTYFADDARFRTLVRCRNPKCEFCARKSDNEGLPVVMVDDELYRVRPSFLIATVDKFARMPFKGETQALFGFREAYSPTYGHLTEAHGDNVGRKIRDAQPAARLLPPDLIIQDELHLISGPLGTMVGLYESAVDFLSRIQIDGKKPAPSKVIASTATIRRASHQVRQLYDRKLSIFPPNGLTSKDSFFAKEREIDPEDDETAGRLYVGVNAPGSSTKTLLVRVYSALLAAGEAEIQNDAKAADPYATLVGYFNSLRALGGAKRLVEDDIKLVRLKFLNRQRGLPFRKITDPEELTSRLDSWKIPGLLKKLDNQFPRDKSNWPVDVLLATNMISVGVDIDRLGLMVVTGQPKATAEYIQATSRVGRKHPGLVVTMYNWLGARDLSHYERFMSYHSALYRYVEAISVTPFSSRALDRGLRGVFVAMNRLGGADMAKEPEAAQFDPASKVTADVIDDIHMRACDLVGKDNADLVRDRLLSHRDDWAHLAEEALRYSWLVNDKKPPNNSRVLVRTAGTDNEGKWQVPGSLREVEPTAAFYLLDEEGQS